MTLDSFSDWFGNLTDTEKVEVWNVYARENDPDNEIFENDEEFFNMFFEGNPMEAVRATTFGDYHFNDQWIWFNGYGNLETSSFMPDFIINCVEDMFDYLKDNPQEIEYLPNSSELLDEEEEAEEEEDTED